MGQLAPHDVGTGDQVGAQYAEALAATSSTEKSDEARKLRTWAKSSDVLALDDVNDPVYAAMIARRVELSAHRGT